MNMPCSKIGFVNIIAPQFPMVEENIERLQHKADSFFQKGETKILIDFSRIPQIDSRGLEFLLDLIEEAKEKRGSIKLCKVNLLCNDIFTATRMTTFLEIYKDPEEAARSFA